MEIKNSIKKKLPLIYLIAIFIFSVFIFFINNEMKRFLSLDFICRKCNNQKQSTTDSISKKINSLSFSNANFNYKDPLEEKEEYFINTFRFSRPIIEKIKEISKKEGGRYYITKDKYFNWIVEDNYLIANHKNMMIYYKNPYCANSLKKIESLKKIFDDFLNTINATLLTNGFELDNLNTVIFEDYDDFLKEFKRRYIYGFKKDNYRCLLRGNLDCKFESSYIKFSCTDDYYGHYWKQIDILKDLNLKESTLNSIFTINNYAIINISYYTNYPKDIFLRGGSALIYKVGNKWREIFRGQNPPSCDYLRSYNVPDDFLYFCYEE